LSVVNEELQRKAELGERASRLLDGGDLRTFVDAYDAMIAEQENGLAPLDTQKFTIMRAGRRIMAEFMGTFLEGVKAEGEGARAEMQGLSPDKRIIL
jgi:hypothetical protein